MKFILILLLSLVSNTVSADELTLMFIRSPEINWTSPKSLANSTVSSFTKTYGLGHVNVRISCEHREVYTGIYNRFVDETRNAVLKKGQGLGVLFNLFEGVLQQEKFIVPSFEKLGKDNRTNFITFKINPRTCERLLYYHDQYQDIMKERQKLPRQKNQITNVDQQIFYGFPAIPRMGEGGGCSAFAISFLEVAGLKEQWMVDEWSQELLVPMMSVGHPMRDDKVGLTSLVFSGPKKWATAAEPHFPLFFWDPDKMFVSMQNRMKDGAVVKSLFQTKGIVLDRTNVPTPTEPIFLNDPYNRPTDPRAVYTDLNELKRRFDLSKKPSF